MPLSSRIIKSKKAQTKKTNEWVIDTQFDFDDDVSEDLTEEENQKIAEELKRAKEKSEAILKEALAEKNTLLKQTEEEIRFLKEQVKKEAYQEGYQAGYETGLQEGKAEGLQIAEIENAGLIQEARNTITEAQLDIEAYIEEKKESLLDLSIHMAEKIVQDQLDSSSEGLLELVHPILHQLDQKEDYVSLTVHPSQRAFVKGKLPELEKNYTDVRFVVLQDAKVNPLGCIVESAHKVIDLQVRKQLEAMVEEMKESEREV